MNKMKDVLLFIVEGVSDKNALEPILAELIDTTSVKFVVLRGDATASKQDPYYNKNMKQRIQIIVKRFLENTRGIKKNHIKKVIYITDTD